MKAHAIEIERFALEAAALLDDRGSFRYYRACAWEYPLNFLEGTVAYVMTLPEDLMTVSRSELFKVIVGMACPEED